MYQPLRFNGLEQKHLFLFRKLITNLHNNKQSALPFLTDMAPPYQGRQVYWRSTTFMGGEHHSGAGGRTYSVREVARAQYLFRFFPHTDKVHCAEFALTGAVSSSR